MRRRNSISVRSFNSSIDLHQRLLCEFIVTYLTKMKQNAKEKHNTPNHLHRYRYKMLYMVMYIHVHAYARESKYIRMYEEYGNDFLL